MQKMKTRLPHAARRHRAAEYFQCGEREKIMFCGNNNGNCCLWIIIILIVLFACGGYGGGYGNGCGCDNGCGC